MIELAEAFRRVEKAKATLLRRVEKGGTRVYSPEAYALVEALLDTVEAVVEAVEPEKHTCGECHYFEPLQERHCAVRPGWMVDVVGSTPACEQFSLSTASLGALHIEVAKAKAEIERLRSERDQARTFLAVSDKGQVLAEAKAEIERLQPLAEIGKLVWGMADRTRLTRGHPSGAPCQHEMYYWAERQRKLCADSNFSNAVQYMQRHSWLTMGEPRYLRRSPAEALRSIQASEKEEA